MPFTIAIDTGGTFTDLAAVSDEGETIRLKVPSTPGNPSRAVLDALAALDDRRAGIFRGQLLHGTTVATNAILEGKGGKAVIITNEGFEDLLALRRQNRPNLYSLHPRLPEPLVPRERILGVKVRRGPSGEAEVPLEPMGPWLERHGDVLAGAESVGICLLHAYQDGEDETAIARAIETRYAGIPITVSHVLSCTFREYERTSTCAANAVLAPLVTRYIKGLVGGLRAQGHAGSETEVLVMGSAGGLMTAQQASSQPVHTVLSGPAGGVRGAWGVGQRCGRKTLLTLDMGGTSTDVSLVLENLRPDPTAEIAHYPLSIPALPIETVGAGGGSIAFVDSGGILRVGPRSAGAHPGPACYGRGGTEPTVTDAHLVLGRITSLLGGAFPLDHTAAHRAVETVGETLNTEVLETARAIVDIAEAHMVRACKRVARERGVDPRTTTLVAFGGAGGLHACGIADELGCAEVLFPREPGVLSAEGIACAPREVHGTRTLFLTEGHWTEKALAEEFNGLNEELENALGAAGHRTTLLDCRYLGQTFTLPVTVPESPDPTTLRILFDALHQTRYGYALGPEHPVELVALRMYLREATFSVPRAPEEGSWVEVRTGPCVVEAYSATLYVPEGWQAQLYPSGDWLCQTTGTTARPEDDARLELEVDIHQQRLASIAEEMGTTLMGSAFSANIKERRDFSCGIFGSDGQLLAHAAHIPVHLGSTPLSVRAAMDAVPMGPGEHVILNDPFQGGTHLPDVTLVSPVFLDGDGSRPSFYVANRAHHADVGGVTPGSLIAQLPDPNSARPITIDDEGFRTGPVLLDQELRTAFEAASRTPFERAGDLRAQEAANLVGIERIRRWAAGQGRSELDRLNEALLAYTERLMRHHIRAMPNGVFAAKDFLDDDGTSQEPVPLALTVAIAGGAMHFDFTMVPEATTGSLNAVRAIVDSAVFYAMRCTAGDALPANEGLMRPLHIETRPGSILDARPPSAVSTGNVETSQRIVDLVFGCLAKALPQRIPAASAGTMNNVLFGGLDPRFEPPRPFVHYETLAGGAGAGPQGPGASGIHVHMTNTLNTPIEALEQAFPVRIDRYALNPEAPEEADMVTGGRGVTRVYRFLVPTQVTLIGERRRFAPFGLHGARGGSLGRHTRTDTEGQTHPLAGKTTFSVAPGESVEVVTPGGGCWQRP